MNKRSSIALSSAIINIDQVVGENASRNNSSKLQKRKRYRNQIPFDDLVTSARNAITEQQCVSRNLSHYPTLSYRNAVDDLHFRFLEIELQLFLDADETKRFGTNESFKQWLYRNFGFEYVTQNMKYYMEFTESSNDCEYRAVMSQESCTLDVKKRIGSILYTNGNLHPYVSCNVAFALESEQCMFTSITSEHLLLKIRRLISGDLYPNAVIRFHHPKDKKCCITWKETAENDNAFVSIEYEISSLTADTINLSLINDFCNMVPNCWSFTTKQLMKFNDAEIKHRPKVFTFPSSYNISDVTDEYSGNLWAVKWDGIQSVLYFQIECERKLSMNLLSSNSSLGFRRIIDISSVCMTAAALKCLNSMYFLCEWISTRSILVITDVVQREALKRYTLTERLHLIRTLFTEIFIKNIYFLDLRIQQFHSMPIDFHVISVTQHVCDGILLYLSTENEILKLKADDAVDLRLDERRRLFTADGVRIAELTKNIVIDQDIKVGSVIEFEIYLHNDSVVLRYLRNRPDRVFANTWQEFCDNYKLVVNNICV